MNEPSSSNREVPYGIGEGPQDAVIRELHGEIERLRAALLKYGNHVISCRFHQDRRQRCDCGWPKVRETLGEKS